LALELRNLVGIENDVCDYKSEVVVEKKLAMDQTQLEDHKSQEY